MRTEMERKVSESIAREVIKKYNHLFSWSTNPAIKAGSRIYCEEDDGSKTVIDIGYYAKFNSVMVFIDVNDELNYEEREFDIRDPDIIDKVIKFVGEFIQ